MRLLVTPQPALRPQVEPSQLHPLDAIAAAFHAGAAQVVFLALSHLDDRLAEPILTETEVERARQLIAPPVRRGFVGGRYLLRAVLAVLARIEPRALDIRTEAHGKPILAGRAELAASFNLSHSGDLAALGLIRARRIGVDIEAERPLADGALLARRIFSPRERERFDSLPANSRAAALLTAWTRKEAVLKGIGTGIGGGLTSVEVLKDRVVPAGEPRATWWVRTLSMPSRFFGAVAVEGEPPRLVTWQAVPQLERSA